MRAVIGHIFSTTALTAAYPLLSIPFASQLLESANPSARVSSGHLLYFIPGVRVSPNCSFSIALLPNTFASSSSNSSDISCTSHLSDSDIIPSWLSFDASTVTFDGIAPSSPQSLNVTVLCWELSGAATASDWFMLQVGNHTLEIEHLPEPLHVAMGNDIHADVTYMLDQVSVDGEAVSLLDGVTLDVDTEVAPWLTWNSSTRSISGIVPVNRTLIEDPPALKMTIQDRDNDTFTSTIVVVVRPSYFSQNPLPSILATPSQPLLFDLGPYLSQPLDARLSVSMKILDSNDPTLSDCLFFNTTSLILSGLPAGQDELKDRTAHSTLPSYPIPSTVTLLFVASDEISNLTSTSSLRLISTQDTGLLAARAAGIQPTIFIALIGICSALILITIAVLVVWLRLYWGPKGMKMLAVRRNSSISGRWNRRSNLSEQSRDRFSGRTFVSQGHVSMGGSSDLIGKAFEEKRVKSPFAPTLNTHRMSVRLVQPPQSRPPRSSSDHISVDQVQNNPRDGDSFPRSITPGLEVPVSHHTSLEQLSPLPVGGSRVRESNQASPRSQPATPRSNSANTNLNFSRPRRHRLVHLPQSLAPRTSQDRFGSEQQERSSDRNLPLRSSSSTDTARNDCDLMVCEYGAHRADSLALDLNDGDHHSHTARRSAPGSAMPDSKSGITDVNEVSRGLSGFQSLPSSHLQYYLSTRDNPDEDQFIERDRPISPASWTYHHQVEDIISPRAAGRSSDHGPEMQASAIGTSPNLSIGNFPKLESPVQRSEFRFSRRNTLGPVEEGDRVGLENLSSEHTSDPADPQLRLSSSYSAGRLPCERSFYDSSPESSVCDMERTEDLSTLFQLTARWDVSLRAAPPGSSGDTPSSRLRMSPWQNAGNSDLLQPREDRHAHPGQLPSGPPRSRRALSKTWEY